MVDVGGDIASKSCPESSAAQSLWQPENEDEAKRFYDSSGLNVSRSAAGGLYFEIDSKFSTGP
jgi:hypothetical protein